VRVIERLRALPWILPLARASFWVTAVAVFLAAVIPPSDHPPDLFGWDKANHFFAFYVLAVIGAAAFPRSSLVVLGLGLAGFGAAIEVIQAIPLLQRDCDIVDWLTDSAAVLAALGPLAIFHWRAGFDRPAPSGPPPG